MSHRLSRIQGRIEIFIMSSRFNPASVVEDAVWDRTRGRTNRRLEDQVWGRVWSKVYVEGDQ